jgi:hypothetical protein
MRRLSALVSVPALLGLFLVGCASGQEASDGLQGSASSSASDGGVPEPAASAPSPRGVVTPHGGGADAGSAPPPRAVDAGPPAPPSCPHVGPPVIDPSLLPACGGTDSGAHCLPASDVPPAMVPELATCPTGYCMPDKLIASGGAFIPATCTSIGGAEGRCENTVLPSVAAQTDLPVATCDSNERCVPCFNILTQADTGACRTSCDPGPTQPPVVLAGCCGGQATCVPPSLIPAATQPFLSAAACSGGDLCTPNENLQATFTPEPCEDVYFSITWYTGVCLSNCLVLPDASDLYQGSCDGLHTCVPCTDPNSGAPTGAPGC